MSSPLSYSPSQVQLTAICNLPDTGQELRPQGTCLPAHTMKLAQRLLPGAETPSQVLTEALMGSNHEV